MFPFHFHFQLSKDVRTRLEISKCWIPWICCVVVLRSMKVNRSATNVDELVTFTGPVYTRRKTVSNISFLFFDDFNLISSTRNIWFSFTILLYYLKNVQVRKEFKNVYMRWKTKDKTYGIQKPTQHFVRGIFTLFTSLCLTRPLSLNETFHIHWFVFCTEHVVFFTCSSPLFAPLFMVCRIFTSSHFSAILLSDPTSPLLGIQYFF